MTEAPKPQGQPGPPDPSGIDQPHDVLAAEEFAMPARDPGRIPPDPIHEPHDVLAAEEFAMPTASAGWGLQRSAGLEPRAYVPLALVLIAAALIVLRVLRSR